VAKFVHSPNPIRQPTKKNPNRKRRHYSYWRMTQQSTRFFKNVAQRVIDRRSLLLVLASSAVHMYSVFYDAKLFVPAMTSKEGNKNGQTTKEVHTARHSFGFVKILSHHHNTRCHARQDWKTEQVHRCWRWSLPANDECRWQIAFVIRLSIHERILASCFQGSSADHNTMERE